MYKFVIDRRIRANLIRLRLKAGLGQNVLAKASGVAHVDKLEAGTRTAGKVTLMKLAEALDVDVGEFFVSDDWRIGRRVEDNLFADMHTECSPKCRQIIKDLIAYILVNELPKKFD